jgi:hypothetical protein
VNNGFCKFVVFKKQNKIREMNIPLDSVNNLEQKELKIILALYIISTEKDEINFEELITNIQIPYQEVFEVIKDLFDLEFIEFQVNDKDHQLYFKIFEDKVLRVDLKNMNRLLFRGMNDILFIEDKEIFSDLVMNIYIPNNLYDKYYMKDFIKEEMKETDSEDIQIKGKKSLTEEQRKKKDERARISRKVNVIIDYFYSKMYKKYGVILTSSQREEEYIQAKNFVMSKDVYDLELIKQGIDWFLEHSYWKQYVTNIYSLNKHFIKFMTQYREKTSDIRYI